MSTVLQRPRPHEAQVVSFEDVGHCQPTEHGKAAEC